MTVIVTEGEGESESAAEATAEVATEVAEAVAEAISDAVESIEDAKQDDTTSVDIAFVAGVAVAENAHLAEEVAELGQRVELAEDRADVAIELAVAAEVNSLPEAEETHEEAAPPDDEPPATRRSKWNRFWFGEKHFQ